MFPRWISLGAVNCLIDELPRKTRKIRRDTHGCFCTISSLPVTPDTFDFSSIFTTNNRTQTVYDQSEYKHAMLLNTNERPAKNRKDKLNFLISASYLHTSSTYLTSSFLYFSHKNKYLHNDSCPLRYFNMEPGWFLELKKLCDKIT
jgi:hypothetical protein